MARKNEERKQNAADPNIDTAAEELPIDGPNDPRAQLTKLSLALMGCQPELSKVGVPKTGGQEVLQAIVFGELIGLTGAKELPNAKSEDEKYTFGLVGRIEGVNAITGEAYQAGILYLPGGFHDMFLAEMEAQIAAAGKGNFTVQFALEFYSIPANNPRGYSWKAKNKMPMKQRDPLEHLRRRALAGSSIRLLAHSPGSDLESGVHFAANPRQ